MKTAVVAVAAAGLLIAGAVAATRGSEEPLDPQFCERARAVEAEQDRVQRIVKRSELVKVVAWQRNTDTVVVGDEYMRCVEAR